MNHDTQKSGSLRPFLMACTLVLASGCTKYQLAHLLLKAPHPRLVIIHFDTTHATSSYSFSYPDTTRNLYLRTLRERYHLQTLTARGASPQAAVLQIMDWTHRSWKHNGNNQPSKPDALSILEEAKQGGTFRCVEYARVLTDALLSMGYQARTLALKSRDAQTCKTGAGHVLVEVFLPGQQKWALLDGQFNVMPLLEGRPLSAVELQGAITAKQDFQLVNRQGTVPTAVKKQYTRFIAPYLYFFETALDNHNPPAVLAPEEGQKTHLMLVPLGANPPTVFQRRFPIDYCHYTHSLQAFYQPPLR
ncbi:MAG: transglutaminase domain-containing protein [Cytophagales bacterium]|nr:transglutaminase domain-containing protein [Cytophagales bacterium]